MAWGTFGLAVWAPVTYLVVSGQVQPGEPYYIDDLAPSVIESVVGLGAYLVVLMLGVCLRVYARRKGGCNTQRTSASARTE